MAMDDGAPVSAPTQHSASRRLGWVGLPLAIFAALAMLFGVALFSGDPSKLPSQLVGKPAPAFVAPALEGLTDGVRPIAGFAAGDLAKGRVSVVNFWASWCVPCIQEHPLLVALKERTGVDLYGINYKDQAPAARRFLGRFGNPFTAVGTDGTGRTAIEWGVYGMPETFVIDGRGVVVYKHVGPITAESLERQVIPAIVRAR